MQYTLFIVQSVSVMVIFCSSMSYRHDLYYILKLILIVPVQIFASDSFLELTEYTREEILGRNCRYEISRFIALLSCDCIAIYLPF